MNPGGGSGWDEPPLDIQIPDDARELDREVLAYHREQRAKRRRNRLRRLAGPFAGRATVMPLLASILAVCLVAGAMLSVATFSPATTPAEHTPKPTVAASSRPPAPTATGSTATVRIAQGLRRPATDRNFLELSLREKTDVPAIRRPERPDRVFCAGHRLRLKGIKRTEPEFALALHGQRYGYQSAIWGDGEAVHRAIFWRSDVVAEGLKWRDCLSEMDKCQN